MVKEYWSNVNRVCQKRYYPTHTIGDIADELGISDTAVRNKVKALGLKRSKSFNPSAFVGRYTFKKYRRKWIMERPKKYRAKDLNGEWVTGWYVELHLPTYDTQIPDRITGYDTVPHLFNDEQGERSKGGYWHSIDISTLTQIEEQLEIAWK